MKILATADIHGNHKIIQKLKDAAKDVDLVLICGDIGGKNYPIPSIREFGECQIADEFYLDMELRELKAKSRYILGNDDWFESRAGGRYLSSPSYIDGLMFAPFEWVSPTPFNTNREINQNMMRYNLEKLTEHGLDWKNTVIVAHMPPLGAGDILYNGSHCGSSEIRNWIESFQPKLWLCGHIHEDNSVNTIGDTLVFNCACRHERNKFAGWVIDTDTLDFECVTA